MPKKVDSISRKWCRNKSDEAALKNGCRMDLERGKFVVSWVEQYCFLYEGEYAGKPMELMKWQSDIIMRIFGWVKYDKDRGRDLRRFKRANVFIAKKSGKSPLLAALGLYMLCGDKESGQKCFSVARDGKQAMIAHTHAMQMVKASESLSAECEINKSTGRITHIPTQSYYAVVSGDNIEGQEGLNGSVFIDELHVCDARLMSVLEYAGASRAEPLQLGVSTAGNNPDGYGKQQFDYGRAVISGQENDEQFFHAEWSLDTSITEADLDKNIVKYGKEVNPSWGKTIFENEFVGSYERAKRSIATLADFKMYRLNQWQQSTNPWLKLSAWQECSKSDMYRPRQLVKRPRLDAYGALDLSRVSDMSAFALALPRPLGSGSNEGEKQVIQFIVRLWLPERYARMNNHLAPFIHWAQQGFLTLTHGDTMDYTIVRRDIKRLCKHFNVLSIAYDQMYAEATMQEIVDGVYNANTGEILEEGIGCERIAFAQTTAGYAQATADFEAGVLDGTIIQPNNPCLNWQIAHCEVHSDAFGNKRPVKPKSAKGEEQSYKKIDSVVSLIMAHSLAMLAEKSAYETGGIFTV